MQEQVTVEGVRFVCSDGFHDYAQSADPGALTLVKTPAMVDRLRQLLQGQRGGRIVELGIAFGGSVALLSLLAEPSKLVAVDLEPEPVEPLARFIAEHGLGASVKPYYGVDQADRERLAGLMVDEFGREPLDLVIDDASHFYGPTRASFECLFPRLRPGGRYLIEDWAWMHRFEESLRAAVEDQSSGAGQAVAAVLDRDEPAVRYLPLSRFAAELMLVVANEGDVIDSVTVDPHWIVVVRGAAPVDPATFRLDDVLADYFDTLTPH